MSSWEESASVLKRIKPRCPNQTPAHKTLWKSPINSHVGCMCFWVPRWCHRDNSYNNGLQSVIMQWLKRWELESKEKYFRGTTKGEKNFTFPTEGEMLNQASFLKHIWGAMLHCSRMLNRPRGPIRFVPHSRLLPPNTNGSIAPSVPIYNTRYLWACKKPRMPRRLFPKDPGYVTRN